MPRGASPKREREYEELKNRFRKEGRYKGREKEVASRIVNKQRAAYAETKAAKTQEREGNSPDRQLPIPRYRHLTARQVSGKLPSLSKTQPQRTKAYESSHKKRKTVVRQIEECLATK